jgi:hypothetical protein
LGVEHSGFKRDVDTCLHSLLHRLGALDIAWTTFR